MLKKKVKFINELKKSGGFDKKLMHAVNGIERENFFDPLFIDSVYSFEPLFIGCGETGDDPATLLRMIRFMGLNKKSRVLEIGTGSGYSTAVIASLAHEVMTIELHDELARKAKSTLSREGFRNIKHFTGDGTLYENLDGFEDFDAAIIFAGCITRPLNVLDTLRADGLAVFPMGHPAQQQIAVFRNIQSPVPEHALECIKFHELCLYPSIRGAYGWEDQVDGYFID